MLTRLAGLFRRKQLESEMSEELRAHLAGLIERNVAAGMSPDEARYAALRAFGGMAQITESARDERRSAWVEQTLHDLRYAVRQLWKSRGFTVVTVLSLALGIGANAFFFGLIDRAIVRSLPVKNPEELIRFQFMTDPNFGSVKDGFYGTAWPIDPGTGKLIGSIFSFATFEQFRVRRDLFSDVFAFAPSNRLILKFDGRTEMSFGQFVSGEYYRGLGLPAIHGRFLLPDDDREGAAPVAVISRRLWQSMFAGDAAVLGKTIVINDLTVTIVGVVANDGGDPIAAGYRGREITLPISTMRQIELEFGARLSAPSAWWLSIMARLRPGVTAAQAAASLDGVFQQTARDGLKRPDDPLNLRAVPGARGLMEFRQQNAAGLWLPTAFAVVVLLAACTNVATMLLARGSARRREIAVRLALGASRGRIVRQLLTESLVLGLLGAAAGLAIAAWGGLGWANGDAWHIDLRVFGFTTAAALVTAIGFGLVPALRATRIDLTTEFQGGVRTLGHGRSWLTRILVIAQVALSCVLLVGAALLVRTVSNLRLVDVGFDRANLLLVYIDATFAGYKGPQSAGLFGQIAERIATLPGVRAATFSTFGQLNGYGQRGFLRKSQVPAGLDNMVRALEVAPNYFETHGIPIVAGRAFTPHDHASGQRVVIINERAAKLYFGEKNPIGHRTAMQDSPVIVGVTRDAKLGDLRSNAPATYLPFAQIATPRATLTIRTDVDPLAMTEPVRKVISATDPKLLIQGVWTEEQQIEGMIGRERYFARLASGFGLLALTLACVGLHGFLAYGVLRRTGEIGLRMALGALPRNVLWMVLRESLVLVVCGVALGCAAAAGAVRFVTNVLYGLSPTDAPTYAGVAVLLIAVALLAAMLPARRAAKIDPMVALRAE
jgi:predicted permease